MTDLTVFDAMYARTDPTFAPYKYGDRRVWRHTHFTGDYQKIPSRPTLHIRGFVAKEFERIHYVIGNDKEARIPRVPGPCYSIETIKRCTFHSQPTDYLYSDIPSWEDVYDFLNWRHLEHIVIGQKYISSLIKTTATIALVEKLWEWEEKRPYKMSRLRRIHPESLVREKYCQSALRGIGIKLKSRLSTRQNTWPHVFICNGIDVHQMRRVPRTKGRTS